MKRLRHWLRNNFRLALYQDRTDPFGHRRQMLVKLGHWWLDLSFFREW